MAAVLLHGFFCVEHQVLRVVHVDVGRFAVGDEQDQFLVRAAILQEGTGMAQCRAHARRQLAGHAGKAGLGKIAVRPVEILEAVVTDIVAAVGRETMDRKTVADACHRVGQQHRRFARQIQHRG